MTQGQAREMAEAFKALGKFSKVTVEQEGGELALVGNPWIIWLWSVNSGAGNRTCTRVDDYAPSMVAAIARRALGKATRRDELAFARQAAARDED